jgi:hypothetical protein
METSVIRDRVDSLLKMKASSGESVGTGIEIFNGAITVMSACYGSESHLVMSLQAQGKNVLGEKFISPVAVRNLQINVCAALRNLRSEIDAGLIGNIKNSIVGDVIADFVQLAKAVLNDGGDKGKNVAAVLTAAAFEDTIRRMGETFAGVVGRDDLSDVINQLKEKGVLQGPQIGIALSYLKFRNDALHADWDKIELSSIHACLGFVEQLLLKHFQ